MSDLAAPPFVAHLGRDAAARCAPRTVFAGGSFASRAGITRQPIGSIGRAASGFGRVLGLSQVQRWSMEDHRSDVLGDVSVRPPIDYWPFADEDDATGVASRREVTPVATPARPPGARRRVDRAEALRRMILGGAKTSEAGEVRPKAVPNRPAAHTEQRGSAGRVPSHRGLPISMRRQGRTWAGPGTAPGRTSATSAPQNTGSVPAARVEPTRAERGERSARTDAQEDRRPARARGRSSRQERQRQRSSAHVPGPQGSAPGLDRLDALAPGPHTIDLPPSWAPSALERALSPEGDATPVVQRSTAAQPTPDGASARSAPTTVPATAASAVAESASSSAEAAAAASSTDDTDARSSNGEDQESTRAAAARTDDGAITRLASLPSSLNEPITRADSMTVRPTEPITGSSNEFATPLVAATDLSVAPSAAAAADAAHESALVSSTEIAQRAVTSSARAAAMPAADTRTVADVLRPVPLATVARRLPIESDRSVSRVAPVAQRHPGEPARPVSSSASVSSVSSASSVSSSRPIGMAAALPASVAAHAWNRSSQGDDRTVDATVGRSIAPMRIGDVRRVRVQRTPDGRGVVWNDPTPGAAPDSGRPDHQMTTLSTVADAVPTAARTLDRALQDDAVVAADVTLGSTPEVALDERLAAIIEAPLRTRPPIAVPVTDQPDQRTTSGAVPPPVNARTDRSVPPAAQPQVRQAQPVQNTPAAVAQRSETAAVAKRSEQSDRPTVSPSPAVRRRESVPATPGSLLGVNLLRRRPLHVDRAVGSLPSLERSFAPGEADSALGALPAPATIQRAAERSSAAGRTRSNADLDPGAAPPQRRSIDVGDHQRPVDLVSDAAVAPRAIPVVRRDLGGHEVTVARPAAAGSDGERLQRSASIGRSDRSVAGSPRAQATDLAERFLAELTRHRDERPADLPTVFRSIADVIVGDRRPLVSTSVASRRALAAVGKQAATTGDVIHLARPLSNGAPSGQLAAVMAHELTHVASPSPEPRFFDDDRDSAEERRAHEVGELMRTAPLAPRVIGASMTAQRTLDPGVARPSIQHGGGTGGTAGGNTTSAADLAARLTGGGSPDTIRRSPASTSSSATVIRRERTEDEGGESQSESSTDSSSTGQVDFASQLRDHFDLIVDLLEERIIVDLERRGGRFRGDF